MRFEDIDDKTFGCSPHDNEIRIERLFSTFLVWNTEGPITPLQISEPANEILLTLRPRQERRFPAIKVCGKFTVFVSIEMISPHKIAWFFDDIVWQLPFMLNC